MPQTSMDWWVIAGVIITLGCLYFAWRQLATKPSGKDTDVNVTGSERVEVDASDTAKSNIGVKRSKDVSINIGGSRDKSD